MCWFVQSAIMKPNQTVPTTPLWFGLNPYVTGAESNLQKINDRSSKKFLEGVAKNIPQVEGCNYRISAKTVYLYLCFVMLSYKRGLVQTSHNSVVELDTFSNLFQDKLQESLSTKGKSFKMTAFSLNSGPLLVKKSEDRSKISPSGLAGLISVEKRLVLIWIMDECNSWWTGEMKS